MKHFSFLLCSERSGSNFLTSLMDGHSAVCGPPPTHLFRLFGTNRQNYGDLARDENWAALVEDVALNLSCTLGSWHTAASAAELMAGAKQRSAGALLRLIYEKEADHDGADHVFVKENSTYLFVPFLLAHFPDCRFVFLVRDPRDVASSWIKTDSVPGGADRAVAVWSKDQSASLALFHQLRDSGRVEMVRYEDLVRDPEEALRRLTKLLGLPFEPGMMAAHRKRRTRANAGRIDAWANLGKPVMRNNYGKFRSVLSEAELRFVELSTYDLMRAFDYEPELLKEPPPADVAAELETLRRSLRPGGNGTERGGERRIRRRRLAAIDRVLSRRL